MTAVPVCRCPQCHGPMYLVKGHNDIRWAVCRDCRAQLPLVSGLHLIGSPITFIGKKVFRAHSG